jgi:ubiquinone/menaquinone biosynthesis C-methylase UbiE
MTESAIPNLTASSDSTRQAIDYNIESAVIDRYQAGAQAVQPSLCCPTDYEGQYLEMLPDEIIEKDYGCGDPSRYAKPGDTVLDLGSGAGKVCYIAAQKVGATGRVIGVDFNDVMLDLARKYQPEIAAKLGYDNVSFVKAKIQDLALNLDHAQTWLAAHPIANLDGISAYETECDRLRRDAPAIGDNTIDLVVSNCVLNLVKPQDKRQLFAELFRVLKRGGRVVISDIVCDEDPTPTILNDPELWSGCISGAFREDEFLQMFEAAGFYGIEILSRQAEPWQVIDGVEFRSLTVRAYKGKQGECLERNQAVIYKGPWKQVLDDDGHLYKRGERTAVCDKTFQILTRSDSPYAQHMIGIEPYTAIPIAEATPFCCTKNSVRDPRVTKGESYRETRTRDGLVCETDSGCC